MAAADVDVSADDEETEKDDVPSPPLVTAVLRLLFIEFQRRISDGLPPLDPPPYAELLLLLLLAEVALLADEEW